MLVQELSAALEQSADSILITNRDGVIEYVNPAFEVMTGFSRHEVIGRTPALVRSGVLTPRFYGTMWNTILAGRPFHGVLTNRTREGRLIDVEQTISPIRDRAGAITHFLSTGRDVTQTRRSDAARLHQVLEQEAARVATLLHAETGQLLTSAHLALSNVARTADAETRAALDDVRRNLARVEEQLRRVAHGAQPRVIADLGLTDAIQYLADDCVSRTGVSVAVESTIDRRCTGTVETLVYRLVQETLSRVQSPPGHGTGTIQLRREVRGRRAQDQTLCCTIRLTEGGEGLAAALAGTNGSLGLRLLRERFESVGGTLGVFTTPDDVELRAVVPMGA